MEETIQQKHFAVVINLSDFTGLNGELKSIDNDHQRENYINQFLLQRFGEGKGRLEIVQKQSKVKLMWFQPHVNPEADALHQQALKLAQNRQYNEAIQLWVQAISINALDPDYYFNLGIAFFEKKNYKESVENLLNAVDICPIYYKAHLILGTVFLKVRQYENAEKHLKESIIFYPRHALAYLNLGAVYSILKRYDEGIKMFLKTLQLAPNEVRAHFGLAKIYSLQGNVEKANKYFKNVIEIDSNKQLTNHAKRAMLAIPASPTQGASVVSGKTVAAPPASTESLQKLYQDGYLAYLYTDYDAAIQNYAQYTRFKPNDDFVWFSLGECYLRSNQILKAVEAFQKAMAINPNKGLYYKECAIAFNYLNKTAEVCQMLEKAHHLGKNDSITNSLMGKCLIHQQNFDEAITHLEKALKQNNNNLFAKFYLAVAHAELDQKEIAVNYLEEIKRAAANSPLKMQAESILEKISR